MAERGKLIGFEGPGRAGKDTQIELAYRFLISNGYDVILTREPGGTEAGEDIRQLIFKLKQEKAINADQQVALFFASRFFWAKRVIEPAIKGGVNVLSNRTYFSTYAFQGFGEGADLESIRKLANVVMEGHKPAAIILLDVGVNTILERIGANGTEGDPFDLQNIDYFERVIGGYREMAQMHWEGIPWYVVDAEKTKDEVAKDVQCVLMEILAPRCY